MMSPPSISGSFAKLRQSTIGLLVSVRPYAGTARGPTGRIVMKINFDYFFRKSVEKIQNVTKI